jgi:hypothetical protein
VLKQSLFYNITRISLLIFSMLLEHATCIKYYKGHSPRQGNCLMLNELYRREFFRGNLNGEIQSNLNTK